jgi:hypothetical protein
VSFLDRLLARLAPINIGDATLGALAHAISLPGEFYEAFVRETTGYSAHGRLMDPDTSPVGALAWLGQFAGVSFLPSDTEATQRSRVKTAAGFYRGTPQAMLDEVKPTLTGTQYASVLQQVSGNRWAMSLITLSTETPDPTATITAALRQKPAGIALTHVVTTGPIVDQGTRTIDAAANTIDSATLADIT